MAPSSSSSSSKVLISNKKLFTSSLLLFLLFLIFSLFPLKTTFYNIPEVLRFHRTPPHYSNIPPWFDFILAETIGRKIKIGFVNINRDQAGLVNTTVDSVHVFFDPISEDRKWNDFFPDRIDENGNPKCPEIPMPELQDYTDLDVLLARVPCSQGNRNLLRLQVNLVVANVAVKSGWILPEIARTMYVVFIGGMCGPMQDIFRCSDLVKSQVGEYLVYKPELRRLKQKVLMPVGSCQLASPYAKTGQESWRSTPTYSQREAYVTVLHSSEAYVCGAIALAQSIRLTSSYKELILLHDDSISNHSLLGLRAAGWKTGLISRIRSPFAKKDAYNEWNYSKLRVWQLLDYDKIIFIDSDVLVLQNIDDFFFYPELSAVKNHKNIFNSGIMLVEPSSCMFEHLMVKTAMVASYNGGDQGFLNELFTWWHRWPSKLNFLKLFKEKDKKRLVPEDVYAVHYLGWKPWMCYRDYDCNWDHPDRRIFASDDVHDLWWKVYDTLPEELRPYCAMTKGMDRRIKKWRWKAKMNKTGFPDRHWTIKVKDSRKFNILL